MTGRRVSTGSLPGIDAVVDALRHAHESLIEERSGEVSTVYPALARVEPDQFGLCVMGVNGALAQVGDDAEFTLMSVAKPFVLAIVHDLLGAEEIHSKIGVNATGMAFNSAAAIEEMPGGRTNPMVNAGAIATTSLVPGASRDERWETILTGISRMAGRQLHVDEEMYASAAATNHRNRALAHMLNSLDAIYSDPDEAVDNYTRQSCIALNLHDLATLGATLANAGVNPVTGEQTVSAAACHDVLAVMVTAGLYETSGDWLWDVGLPGKSGISGAIVTVSPGKGGLGAFSPRLDAAGNSVRGQLASARLAAELGLDVFASERFSD